MTMLLQCLLYATPHFARLGNPMQDCHLRKEPALRDLRLCLQCCMAGTYSPCLQKKNYLFPFICDFFDFLFVGAIDFPADEVAVHHGFYGIFRIDGFQVAADFIIDFLVL